MRMINVDKVDEAKSRRFKTKNLTNIGKNVARDDQSLR